MNSTSHLTGDQISEFLAASSMDETGEDTDFAAVESHLATCGACSAELTSLRESLAFFQEASIAFADRELARTQRPLPRIVPVRRPVMQTGWWLAAAAVLMAALVPMQMRWQHAAHAAPTVTAAAATHTIESDEALLADIDRDLSASLPTTMQALADPAGTTSTTKTSTANSPQRTN